MLNLYRRVFRALFRPEQDIKSPQLTALPPSELPLHRFLTAPGLPPIRSQCRWELITINKLPDDVLLQIFDFYVIEGFHLREKQRIEEWITLAHVCRRWRSVVFQSPRRLNLRLVCGPTTPARDTLDIWPPLPLIIRYVYAVLRNEPTSDDNIIAALERNDCVCEIKLNFYSSSQMGYVADSPAIQNSFPELEDLHLSLLVDGPGPILPDSFLGGTAPRLRSLVLNDIPFPGLPKLLLSATHLVKLDLYGIPLTGYIPPQAMAIRLSALTSLEYLRLHFRCPRPRPTPETRRLPPPTRSILPRLTKIGFKGTSEYLEEVLARIDAPQLYKFNITFFNQIIFNTPQLFQFISRRPTLRELEKGFIVFNSMAIIVKFPSQTSDHNVLSVQIPCTASEWQLSSIEQVCTSSLPPASTLGDLYIWENRGDPPRWQDDVESALWLELLRPFAAVKSLYLCKKTMPRIAPALHELVGARTAEVLPILENIFFEGSQPSGFPHEGIEKFFAARRLTHHPVAVSCWDMDSEQFSFATPGHTNRPDYPRLLNNLLQGHRTGNLSPYFHYRFVMSKEGPEDIATHVATAMYRDVNYAAGKGKTRSAARAAAARIMFEDVLENGIPGT